VKYETTLAFDGDVRRLHKSGDYEKFREVLRDKFIPAAERQIENPGKPWPGRLRVKGVRNAQGILELTWEVRDGRATFEWVEIDGEAGIRWRRAGDHSILSDP